MSEALIKKLTSFMRVVEFAGLDAHSPHSSFCVSCGKREAEGHRDDCHLRTLLTEAEEFQSISKENKHTVTLIDMGEGKDEQEVMVRTGPQGIYLYPKGYGEYDAADGEGSPVFLEIFNGELRVVVSDDINDPDKIILPIMGALESLREDHD